MASLLYEDKFVRLTEESVELKWYYFPFGTSKVIPWSDIESFQLEPVSLMKSKGWGMGLSNVWYACDLLRQMSDEQRRFLSITLTPRAGQNEGCCLLPCFCLLAACCSLPCFKCRKGFSCENLAKVTKIMREKAVSQSNERGPLLAS